jgi:glucose/arabinose dehydrogenase
MLMACSPASDSAPSAADAPFVATAVDTFDEPWAMAFLNLIERGANYGYPIVSNGDHYDGRPIPDHATRPDVAAPRISWKPVISPSSLVIYSGDAFSVARQCARHRPVVAVAGACRPRRRPHPRSRPLRHGRTHPRGGAGPDGTLWLLEDGSRGRLLKLQAKRRGISCIRVASSESTL